MIGQFAHYTREITLRPFGGDPSIHYKWQIAQQLERAAEQCNKPIVILYFGDLRRQRTAEIPQSAARDIEKWCNVEFDFIQCGLNIEQVEGFGLPEDPDRPGQVSMGIAHRRTGQRDHHRRRLGADQRSYH